jgi:hypothetical protein
MDNQGLMWVKSSYSSSGNCVEVADHDHHVMIRDTNDRTGPTLRFTPAAWRRFADSVKRLLAGPLPSLEGRSRVVRVPLRRLRGRFLMAGAARWARDAVC